MFSYRTSLLALAVVATAIAFVSSASAQVDSSHVATSPAAVAPPPSGGIQHIAGGYFVGSFPQGDWGEIAGFGLALDGADVVTKPGKSIGVRSSMGLLYNFSRTVDVPASQLGTNDKLNIETKNWSLFFGIGPELSLANKNMTPFLFGTVGFDTYWTGSTLSGTAGGSSYSAEHGDSRISLAWAAGVGFRRHVAPGYKMELSAEYRSGTDHQYLRPEDVTSSGGVVTANRSSHASDQILIRFGTVLGD
jgi:hypothetical protein